MKIALVLISIIAIVTLIIGGCVHRYKSPEKRTDYITQKITKKLGLNDAQKTNLDTLKNEILAVRKELQTKRDENRDTISNLLNTPKLDQDKAMTVVNGHINGISSQAPQVIAALASFWDSLNPEQQAKVREKMDKHFEYQGHWNHGCCRHM